MNDLDRIFERYGLLPNYRRRLRDSDGTATAALCEDIAVPQDCQARAEGIAESDPDPIQYRGEM